jgi:replication factor C subunit 3/5
MTADHDMPDARAGIPFSEKYRPQSLSDVSSHTDIISTITKLLEHDQLPHLLFYGPPGTGTSRDTDGPGTIVSLLSRCCLAVVSLLSRCCLAVVWLLSRCFYIVLGLGHTRRSSPAPRLAPYACSDALTTLVSLVRCAGKTSTILAMAKHIYGPKHLDAMTLELNASDDRGISIVRNEIQEFASTRTMVSNKFKLIILDECDAMTKDAQMALRRVMEKYVKNARFCLICNYVSKIIPALQSRCTRFRFMPLPVEFVRQRIEHVCANEGIGTSDPAQRGGVDAVIALGGGDMRRTLNLLQSVAMGHNGQLSEENVYATAGKPLPKDIEEIVQSLLNDDLRVAFQKIKALTERKGIALVDVLYELHDLVFRIGMGKAGRLDLVHTLSEVEWNLMGGSSREELQLGAVVGAFVNARESMVREAV